MKNKIVCEQTDLFGVDGIGRCWTCKNKNCPHPKIKQKTPEKGF